MRLNRSRQRRGAVPLSAPRQNSFVISAVLAVLGVAGALTPIPVVSPSAFWLVAIGYVILVVSCLTKGF